MIKPVSQIALHGSSARTSKGRQNRNPLQHHTSHMIPTHAKFSKPTGLIKGKSRKGSQKKGCVSDEAHG